MKKPKISVVLPVYNGAEVVSETIQSVLRQSFKDFELVVCDNVSLDNTAQVVGSFRDERIKYYRNAKNLGCGGNLTECARRAKAEIIFYLCHDDILAKSALEKIYQAFLKDKNIGIVTRPYFWFDKDIKKPIRITRQFEKDELITLKSSFKKIIDVVALSDQISGIAFRRKYLLPSLPFSQSSFVEMASVVLRVFKKSKAYILKDNILAVRVTYSGSRNSLTYQKSPMMVWRNLVEEVFFENKFKNLRNYLIKEFIAKNYVGLVQIKNYGGMKFLIREICLLLKLRWRNILVLRFWIYALLTLLIPGFILRKLTIAYKNEISMWLLKKQKLSPIFES